MKEWLGRRYSKQEVNLGILFLNERIAELLRVNSLLNISHYPAFQNVRSTVEELQILLAPDKDYKKDFPSFLIVEFQIGKSLKDYLMRTALPKMNNSGAPLNHLRKVLVKCVIN